MTETDSPAAHVAGQCPCCGGEGSFEDSDALDEDRGVTCPDCAGSGKAADSITANEKANVASGAGEGEPAFAFVREPLPWAQARSWLLAFDRDYPGLDPGIRDAVRALRASGVETFESCEGGPGHAYAEPTVRFHGDRSAGWRALTAAQEVALPVSDLRRTWPIIDGEPVGPYWEIVFSRVPTRQ